MRVLAGLIGLALEGVARIAWTLPVLALLIIVFEERKDKRQ